MGRRRDENTRILGPTWIPSRDRWRVLIVTPGARKSTRRPRYFVSRAAANAFVEEIEPGISKLASVTVEHAIDGYHEFLIDSGTKESSANETRRRLRLFFPSPKMPLTRVTPERARDYYDRFRARTKDDGSPISVDYHRSTLINARSMCTWAIGEGLIDANPFAAVRGIGKRRAGKEQHTADEARRFYAYLVSRAPTDDPALALLMLLLMALRTSDVLRRQVRDVDLDATQLRVERGKTARSNRPRRIPAVLQPLLRARTKGREASAPLFAAEGSRDGYRSAKWLYQAMQRYCPAAGVPFICPHALKGQAGTILAETGALADQIADHLSHEETGTSRRHYVAKGAMEEAAATRALTVLQGGKR
jgi:integrase